MKDNHTVHGYLGRWTGMRVFGFENELDFFDYVGYAHTIRSLGKGYFDNSIIIISEDVDVDMENILKDIKQNEVIARGGKDNNSFISFEIDTSLQDKVIDKAIDKVADKVIEKIIENCKTVNKALTIQ